LCIGREIEDVAVAAGAEQDGVAGPALHLAAHEVTGDDALGVAVDEHQVEHLAPGVHLDLVGLDHPRQ
jgi:hypothetical protein